jgi:acyl-CoA synthetase (AMP-forming)/AMP-acid ligase II
VVYPERRVTREDVDALARRIGQELAAWPLPPGSLVGLAAANGAEFLASFLALRRAGLAVLLLDAQTPEAEAVRILRALKAPALLRHGPLGAALTGLPGEKTGEGRSMFPGTAVVKLTSGSTGSPRGIAASSEALMADDEALTATMGLSAADRLLTTIPLSHSYGLSSLAVPALVRGTVLALPEETGLYDPFGTARSTSPPSPPIWTPWCG